MYKLHNVLLIKNSMPQSPVTSKWINTMYKIISSELVRWYDSITLFVPMYNSSVNHYTETENLRDNLHP